MSILYFLKNFNNYYNRIIKKYDSISDYLTVDENGNPNYAVRGNDNLTKYENKGPVNFSINDGITSAIPYNYDRAQTWEPDYVVVCDENNNIASRWFVIEARRTRKGQYDLQLRRDLVADNYEGVINSPCFIEKALIPDTDSAIYNYEDMTFNQIKSGEDLLVDKTGCAWIVGYVATNVASTESELKIDISGTFDSNSDEIVSSLSSYEYYNYSNIVSQRQAFLAWDYSEPVLFNVRINSSYVDNLSYILKFKYNGYLFSYIGMETSTDTTTKVFYTDFTPQKIEEAGYKIANDLNQNKTNISSATFTFMNCKNQSETDKFLNENDKLIKSNADNNQYKVRVKSSTSSKLERSLVSGSSLELYFRDILLNYFSRNNNTASYISCSLYRKNLSCEIKLSQNNVSFSIRNTARNLTDSPYKMFAIPYLTSNMTPKFQYVRVDWGDTEYIDMNWDLGLKIANLMTKAGSGSNGWLYDIQILPYCPFVNSIIIDEENDEIDLTNNQLGRDFEPVFTSSATASSFIYWCDVSNFSFDIDKKLEVENKKIQNQTDSWRLCSPNYSGLFEFNIAQNNGVDYFNIDCSYKPYQPYIHINPNFKNLYGYDYNDARGLICSGDFSLPQTSDAWQSYVRNNVNYQNSFDRSIENLQIKHKYQMAESGLNAITSAIGTGISAGKTFESVGGGLAAGALSFAGGIADQAISQRLYNENIDYTKDQFGFQLANIQALPNSLSKVSSLTYNNKIFPFLEYYTCTDEERTALENKIKYNGMTVGRIGKISDYLYNGKYKDYGYIKGKLIRLLDNSMDYHEMNEIGLELSKGVFIKDDTISN